MTVASGQRQTVNIVSIDDVDTWSQILASTPSSLKKPPDEDGYVGRVSLNRKLRLVCCDITHLPVDALVCAVQTDLHLPPVGMCKDLWMKGGLVLKQACLEVGTCEAGQAFLTNGYNLLSKYVIHTAGPSPTCLMNYSDRVSCLRQSYLSCLNHAALNEDIHSVVFPCLGSGGAGIQLSDAVAVGMEAIRSWLEQGTNVNKVDHIVLCMYNEDMRSVYVDNLRQVFPSGKDLADLDLEQLSPVDTETLAFPQLPPGNATPVLCFKYEPGVGRTIQHHFHNMVNVSMEQLSGRRIRAKLETRYRDCVIIKLKSHCYNLIVYHSPSSCTIELQLVNFSKSARGLDKSVCQTAREVVHDYLTVNLENLLCGDVEYMRCDDSPWGSGHGLWAVHTLGRQAVGAEVLCSHEDSLATTHTVTPRSLLKYWHSHSMTTEQRGAVSSSLSESSESDPQPVDPPGSHRSVDENSDDEESHAHTTGPLSRSESDSLFKLSPYGASGHSGGCFSDSSGQHLQQSPHRDTVRVSEIPSSPELGISGPSAVSFNEASAVNVPTVWRANITQDREQTEHSDHFITDDYDQETDVKTRSVSADNKSMSRFERLHSRRLVGPKVRKQRIDRNPNTCTQGRIKTDSSETHHTTHRYSSPVDMSVGRGTSNSSEYHRTHHTGIDRTPTDDPFGRRTSDSDTNIQHSPPSLEQLIISEPVMWDYNLVSPPDMSTNQRSHSDSSPGASVTDTDDAGVHTASSLPTPDASRVSGHVPNNRQDPTIGRTQVLTDEVLSRIVGKVGSDHYILGLRLGIDSNTINVIIHNNQNNTMRQCFHILETWRNKTGATIDRLLDEMKDLGMETEYLRKMYGCREMDINH